MLISKLGAQYNYPLYSYADIAGTNSSFYIAWRKSDAETRHVQSFIEFAVTFSSTLFDLEQPNA